MRIVCPSCSAAYDVPDSLVTAGRTVQCARCHGEWVPVTAPPVVIEAVAEVVQVAEPESAVVRPANEPDSAAQAAVTSVRRSAMERLAAAPAQPRSPLTLWLAWGLSIVVIAAAVWTAYAWRDQVIAAWPPSARAYAVFGLK